MEKVTNLIDFMQIICNRPNVLDYFDNDKKDNQQLSRMNEIVKEFMNLNDIASKEDSKNVSVVNKLDQFVSQNYEYIFSYKYARERSAELNSSKGNPLSFFYRGVGNSTHPIASGIYRSSERHEENYYFNEISVRCPEAFHAFDNLEKLTYMQHYGCPTRLLDITSNPLVALYFACEKEDKHDGIVYIFGVDNAAVLYANSDRIQMLSKVAEFKKRDQDKLRLLAYRNILKNKFPQHSNGKYKDAVLEQYYHAIKRNNGAFEREIVPYDMLKPQFVQPNKDNPRILKQDGAFIVSGLDTDDTESNMKIHKYVVSEIFIPSSTKAKIRQELEYVGINQATLFPEVDKVADYLRKKA